MNRSPTCSQLCSSNRLASPVLRVCSRSYRYALPRPHVLLIAHCCSSPQHCPSIIRRCALFALTSRTPSMTPCFSAPLAPPCVSLRVYCASPAAHWYALSALFCAHLLTHECPVLAPCARAPRGEYLSPLHCHTNSRSYPYLSARLPCDAGLALCPRPDRCLLVCPIRPISRSHTCSSAWPAMR